MNSYLLISDAAKEVKVESHVLRYWEEELHLPIKRNELGHRYYTNEDVERFKQIKSMKEGGLQLKAIKMILRDGRLDMLAAGESETSKADSMEKKGMDDIGMAIEIVERHQGDNAVQAESKEDKAKRLQWLLQQLIRETLRENNQELCREMKESIVKELDYQFRNQQERQEEWDRRAEERSEEYYKKMDELLRKKSKESIRKTERKKRKEEKREETASEKKKRHFVF